MVTGSASLCVALLGYWRFLETRRFSHFVRPNFVRSHIVHTIRAMRLHMDSYRQHARSVVPTMQGREVFNGFVQPASKPLAPLLDPQDVAVSRSPRRRPCVTETMHKACFDVGTACAISYARETCMLLRRGHVGPVRLTCGHC